MTSYMLLARRSSESPAQEKSSGKSIDRDAALAQVETEKKMSFIKAWEESEKTKAENKAQKKKATIILWENAKKAALEAELKKIEVEVCDNWFKMHEQEKYENKKAGSAEKIRNKIAMIRKAADEKRAMVDAKRGEELVKAEEAAAKYRATGQARKKGFSCCCGA